MSMNQQTKKQLENLAKSFEKDFTKIEAMYDFAKDKIAAETGKKDPALSIAAVHAVRAHLTKEGQVQGKEMNVIFLGKDASRDQNATIIKERLEKFNSDPESRKTLIKEGKLILMPIKGKNPKKDPFEECYNPVIEITKSADVDGRFVVIDGEIWTAGCGKDPILRDDREYLDEDGERENWNFDHPLEENWRTTYWGIGFFEDTPTIKKRVDVRFFGEQARPSSGQFVGKGLRFFEPYKIKVLVQETMSNEENYVVNARSDPVLNKKPGEDIDIMGLISGVNESHATRMKSKKNASKKPLIQVVPLADLKQWHLENRAQLDEDGNVKKAKSGWDLTNWGAYAIVNNVTFLGVQEFKNNYTPASIQDDSTGKETIFVNFDSQLDMSKIPVPSDVVISVKTGRGTSKYDRESRETIQNAEDPDLNINICGIKTLVSYDKIIFPRELTGDL